MRIRMYLSANTIQIVDYVQSLSLLVILRFYLFQAFVSMHPWNAWVTVVCCIAVSFCVGHYTCLYTNAIIGKILPVCGQVARWRLYVIQTLAFTFIIT
jgi:hypothetical protein